MIRHLSLPRMARQPAVSQMTTAPNREALAARVRKLSKMTTSNGCSETEAAFASAKIAAIMAEHALTQDELSLKEDAAHCLQDEFIIWGQEYGDWWRLQQSIARLFDCKCWGMKVHIEEIPELGIGHPVRPFVFYGMPYDVAASIATMSICYSAVSTAALAERKNRADFGLGMVMRLCNRIDELKPKQQTGSALIVLKDQLVTEAFAKTGIKLRHRLAHDRPVDQTAYRKGFAAGAHVDIHGGRNATASAPAQRRLA